MAFSVSYDKLQTNEILCEASAEQSVEGEYVIPDYLPEVQNILKCQVRPVIMQKLCGGQKVTAEGYVLATVFYLTAGGEGPYSVTQRLPFSKSFELKSPVGDSFAAAVNMTRQYFNCRALNSRKLDLRGAFTMEARIIGQQDAELVSEVTGDSAQQRVQEADMRAMTMFNNKQFTLEEEFEAAGQLTLLRSDARLEIDSARPDGDSVAVEGTAVITAAFTDSGGEISRYFWRVPFSQLVDMGAEVTQADEFLCEGDVVSLSVEPQSDQNAVSVSATCWLEAAVASSRHVKLVTDAFSTRCDCAVTQKEITVIDDVENVSLNFNINRLLPGGWTRETLVDSFVESGALACADGKLTAHATLCYFAKTEQGETVSREIPFEFELACENAYEPEDLWQWKTVFDSFGCSLSDAGVAVKAAGTVSGGVVRYKKYVAASSVQFDENSSKPQSGAAMYIYYADAGESVWEIAKKYNTSVEGILAHNELESEEFADRTMLLIPILG